MSVELEYLAKKINSTDMQAEFSRDESIAGEAYNLYCIIIRDITFIQANALLTLERYLNENGKKAYRRYYEKWVGQEVIKQGRRRRTA